MCCSFGHSNFFFQNISNDFLIHVCTVNFFSQCLFDVAGPVFELFVFEYEEEDNPSETIFDRFTSDFSISSNF